MARQHRRLNSLTKIIQALAKRLTILFRRLGKAGLRQLHNLLRQIQRSKRPVAMAGFVLPTTVLMILVLALTVGALIHRAYSHTTQIIGESQQRVIYNAATPAIDRARSKLETLFDANRDNRYPGGIPAQNYLAGMLRNDGSYNVNALATDIYTLPGERRINLDGQTKTGETQGTDNAWAFRTDTNGDGTADATVVYSILLQTPTDLTANSQVIPGSGVVSTDDQTKAQNLWVRTAPLSNRQKGNCGTVDTQAVDPAAGWFQDSSSSSTLRKNFQIDAIVIPDTARTRPNYVTLEMQQDRQLDRGNKWGAWFRNDLEIYPGAPFNWNGAMHTEGNLIVQPVGGGSFTAYLVSARNSCLMSTATTSEITVTNIANANNAANQAPDFIGGVLSGTMRFDTFDGSSTFHLWPAPAPNTNPTTATLDSGSDSATASAPSTMALNPTALLTQDVSLARGSNVSNRSNVTTGWRGLLPTSNYPRIYNQSEAKPYVDDLYRADDRWGPKPRYSDLIALNGANQQPGTLITSGNVSNASDLNALISNTAPANNSANVGLDGYWERRARNEGARIIVGQRLELGNTFGWMQDDPSTQNVTEPTDYLYPPDPTTAPTIPHQQLQRRALRDNLAAVQSTAFYHSGSANPDFPVACLASTSHPGSLGSLVNSITFNISNNAPVIDFLTGNGTNGWEFAPPAASESAFATAVGSGQPLGKALRNLAYFAGDPDGAFPPLQEAGRVHPYPKMAMWGNFAELRRTLARLDGGTTYANLSLADKTTLHTAACTLGMLAYNIETSLEFSPVDNGNGNSPGLSMLGTKMYDLIDGKTNNGEVRNPATGNYFSFTGNNNPGPNYATQAPAAYGGLPPEAFINALLTEPINGLSSNQKDALLIVARALYGRQQIQRDRIYGFKTAPLPPPATTSGLWAQNGNRGLTKPQGGGELLFPTGCDPDTFQLNNGQSVNAQANQKTALALAFCESTPRYPALYYLFPVVNHDHDGSAGQGDDQPPAEEYIADPYIANLNSASSRFQAVGSITTDSNNNLTVDFTGLTIQPRATDFSNWVLPQSTVQAVTGANVSPNLIRVNGTNRAVGFLERSIFNGREMMAARVMDIDLGMLRSIGTSGTGNQPWLPTSGIIYAFREDAVREDAIARPPAGTQTNATSTSSPTDPARATTPAGITTSVKQVDYIADPDRRPYGFRLRNGAQLKRNASFGIAATDNIRGLSFFTDDPVYIQGNFNLHQDGADNTVGTRLEEFSDTLLNGSYADFYNRVTRSNNFARPTTDRWRPTEILADSITILSDNFCDGSMEDTFVTPTASNYHNTTTPGLWGPGCSGANTSFTNQNLPNTGSQNWLRENSADTSTVKTSGVRINRNGTPMVAGGANGTAYAGNYQAFSDNKALMSAQDTIVNSIIVSGLVPSRAQQGNGGLHNFPRFIESWQNRTLQFNGAFLQLNFSNYATAPFEQDAWEPGTNPTSDENIQYYWAPNRAWGYDTALQLAPAGPAARRFITASRNRNEYYTEVSASDAFMKQLCTAFNNTAKTAELAGAPATVPCQ